MELIYLWVENFHNINQKGFSFSSNFDVTFIDHELKITKRKSPPINVYPSYISGITALVGKNGSGKSSIIELLGEKELNRRRNRNNNDSWFLLYWINGNRFVVEEMLQITEKEQDSLIKNFNDDRAIFRSMHNPTSLYCEYNFETQEIKFKKYLQDVEENKSQYAIQFYMPRAYGQKYNTESLRRDHVTSQYIRHIFYEKALGLYRKYVFLIHNRIENLNKKSFCDLNYTNIILNISVDSPDFIKKNESGIDEKIKGFNGFSSVFNETIIAPDETKSLAAQIQNSPEKKLSSKNQCLILFLENLIKIFSLEFNAGNIPEIDSGSDYGIYLLNLLYAVSQEVESNLNNGLNDHFVIKEVLEVFFRLILGLPDIYFSSSSIEIPIDHDEPNEQIGELFEFIDNTNSSQHKCSAIGYFSFNWIPLSDGEEQFLHLTSSIFTAVQKYRFNGLKHVILLLDEPDNKMHPETVRQFLSYIISELKRYHRITFQVIIASHSPLLLSDIPSHSVILLEKNLQTGNCIIRETTSESFAANIHTLLANDFFMKSTIGAWAENYIQTILKDIGMLKNKTDIRGEYFCLKRKIEIIAENIIRYQLEQKLAFTLKNDNIARQEKINILKKEIAELEQQND